jgi:hypothetical protein
MEFPDEIETKLTIKSALRCVNQPFWEELLNGAEPLEAN